MRSHAWQSANSKFSGRACARMTFVYLASFWANRISLLIMPPVMLYLTHMKTFALNPDQLSGRHLVQSLNSPFFPPHIGAEPGRAKEESRITCMRMLRTPPFFPPKSGEKPYLEVFSRFGFWRNFLNDNI